MSYRGKFSSRAFFAVLAAAIGLAVVYGRGTTRPGHVSLPAVEVHRPIAAGKARITKIVDGDTVHVLLAGDSSTAAPADEKVRLFGINTPELHPRPGTRKEDFKVEPFAQEACDRLTELCPVGSDVGIELRGHEKYGRLLGILTLPDGRDVNRLLLEAGYAKAYFLSGSKKDPLRLEYERAEAQAREARRGIWK